MRKALSALLALVMCFAIITACMAESTASTAEYTGTGTGFGGEIVVKVTVGDGKILSVDVVSHNETEGIGTNALEILPQQIVQTQSLAVDAVAGCTLSSNGLIEAVTNALSQSDLDMNALTADSSSDEKTAQEVTLETDLVVVGAGGAGAAAALSAAEEGADVILLEKMAFIGGSSATCGGGLGAAGSSEQIKAGAQDDADAFFTFLLENGHQKNNEALSRLYADHSGEMIDWLLSNGVALTSPEMNDQPYGDYVAVGTGAALMQTLGERINENEHITLMLQTKAEELVTADGAVVGVKATAADGTSYTIKAKAVVLATGGFANNRDMLPDSVANIVYYGPVSSIGDGHAMAMAVGGQIANTDWIAIKPNGVDTGNGLGKYTQPANKQLWAQTGAISVNLDGVRVTDENASEAALNEVYLAQEDESLYTVMDQAAYDLFVSTGIDKLLFTQEEIDGWLAADGAGLPRLVSGDTLEAAAEKMGINAENLTATVAHYNEMVAQGEDTDFGRKVSQPLGDGPYYILKQNLRFAQTLGGIVANADLQIVDADGNPIAGLYGAGELVGGSQGDQVVSLLGWSITSGRYVGLMLGQSLK